MEKPYRDNNFWFKAGTPQAGVLACYNNVVLLDRRKVASGELRDTSGRWNWAVYDASDTRYYGEWHGYKTRKAAVANFVHDSQLRPRFEPNELVKDTIVEGALRESQRKFEESMKDYPIHPSEGTPQQRREMRAIKTGEFRKPKLGEWYLSGAIVEAYQQPTAQNVGEFHIAILIHK